MIGNIVVAFLLSMVFIFTELILFETWTTLIIPAGLAFGLSLIREIIKDISDYQGDKKAGITTLPVWAGCNFSIKLLSILIIIFCVVAFFPYVFFSYTINYLIALIIIIEIPLIIMVFLMINKPTQKLFKVLVNVTKYITIGGLIVILVSAV